MVLAVGGSPSATSTRVQGTWLRYRGPLGGGQPELAGPAGQQVEDRLVTEHVGGEGVDQADRPGAGGVDQRSHLVGSGERVLDDQPAVDQVDRPVPPRAATGHR